MIRTKYGCDKNKHVAAYKLQSSKIKQCASALLAKTENSNNRITNNSNKNDKINNNKKKNVNSALYTTCKHTRFMGKAHTLLVFASSRGT